MPKALLFDVSRCTACRGCQAACKQWWELKGTKTVNRGSYENPTDLTPENWLRIKFREVKEGSAVRWVFTRNACMHCTQAACVWVCPTGTRKYSGDGYITLEQDRCIGCGRCVTYCPFSVPRLGNHDITWRFPANIGVPKPVTYQCLFCPDRVEKGLETACAKTCPPDAIIFGERAELVEKGRARVNAIKSRYPNAYLYGEKELEGLHVMFVLTDEPSVHGLPVNPAIGKYPDFDPRDLPTWFKQAVTDGVLSASPDAKPEWYMQPKVVFPPVTPKLTFKKDFADYTAAALAAAGVGVAAYFIIQRRMDLQKGYKPKKRA